MSEESIAFRQYKDSLIEQGAFEMALKIKEAVGLDKAVEISGFSRDELENEKLNR